MNRYYLSASVLLTVYISCATVMSLSSKHTSARSTKLAQAAKSSHFLLTLLDNPPHTSEERDAPEDLEKVVAYLITLKYRS